MSDQPLAPEQLSAAVLAVATTRGVLDEAEERAADARAHARTCLLPYVRAGVKSLTASLPDGPVLGTLSFVLPAPRVRWDQEAIMAFVEQVAPTEIDEDVDPAILSNPDVVEWILNNHPEAAKKSVRPKFLSLLEEDLDAQGCLIHPDTGEAVDVATVSVPRPTGQFQWKPDRTQHPKLLAAVRGGSVGSGEDLLTLLPDSQDESEVARVDTDPTDGVPATRPVIYKTG